MLKSYYLIDELMFNKRLSFQDNVEFHDIWFY